MIKRSAQSVEISLVTVVVLAMQKSELLISTQEVLLENFSLEISNSDGGILWFSSRQVNYRTVPQIR
jgi:hypothetical protein